MRQLTVAKRRFGSITTEFDVRVRSAYPPIATATADISQGRFGPLSDSFAAIIRSGRIESAVNEKFSKLLSEAASSWPNSYGCNSSDTGL